MPAILKKVDPPKTYTGTLPGPSGFGAILGIFLFKSRENLGTCSLCHTNDAGRTVYPTTVGTASWVILGFARFAVSEVSGLIALRQY